VDPTCFADDVDEALWTRAFAERATRKTPGPNLVPRDGLQLEKPVSIDERAADEPGEWAELQNLEMHG
jgi:hypothetical protein